ncbi:hypothetical protein A3A76_05945 [Candidatus Woesebacteria bacterium RIFCSPLOWO2_01_FULL_39_23]|uniref:Glycosyltransferase RgtA/B/C/D-like domain-containing protein n=1 Tax=Candidatus Woesebacteria bacterium RIFCSPHIGHO2_01_FULL_40_22 TaxID=1802499 RepID=A0A1F7YHW2_9BACT|nr:MAG: hypothetical protein A2141_02645 [Candidatus Woesebacteria bacterium RBG_16_40_11]OGM26944.1 MAG: hypothetical protein A2628_05890 [Candidatus Woesebacteria bacterium RIFCSPHIGHO2_01_FULL_40_22]OGM37351.1 MAG: hypothetical protein A3E41_04290 [Candidatus Woesebacteria bacterium RIFCSPHIGHO2_12_FULL_38_9]OGM63218.1 MAG: hypothetical protein A3A76_05945 [Candidatus Woesebacteria bacterium RIFCSPLOWO2_01_FULL_39_23]
MLFIVCFIINIGLVTVGWKHSLSDFHGFRQSQVAISIYYLLKDGFTLNYQTPVLGAPWSIPLEFPTYQFLVASLVKIFGFQIETTGRFVSLVFFYLCITTVLLILKELGIEHNKRLLSASLILISPVYIFWSRTTLIESTALALSLLYIYFLILAIDGSKKTWLMLATAIIGSIAGMTKPTTFTPFIFLACVIVFSKFKTRNTFISEFFKVFIFYIGVPLVFSGLWLMYAGFTRNQNPLAGFLSSTALTKMWYLGAWQKRLSFFSWKYLMLKVMVVDMPYVTPLVILGLVCNIFRKIPRRDVMLIIGLMLSFLIGPVIFTKLWYYHDYYAYESEVFLLIVLGIFLVHLINSKYIGVFGQVIIIPVCIILSIYSYKIAYYKYQSENFTYGNNLGAIIERQTKVGGVILYYINDWNTQIPYYSKRKALMDRENLPLTDPKIQRSLELTGRENIAGVLSINKNRDFLKPRIDYFGLKSEPVYEDDWAVLYTK